MRHRVPPTFNQKVSTYRKLWTQTHFLGPVGEAERVQHHEQLQAELLKLFEPQGKAREIPVEVYYRRGVPVIFQGKATHWQCVQQWTPEWLAKHYGEDKVALIDAAPKDLEAIDYALQYTTLAELVAEMDDKPLALCSL